MTMPIYASAEQFMRDRSELARKGIARGRSVVVLTYSGGVLFVAENHSTALHKVGGDLRPDRVRRGRPVQRVREPAHRRDPARRRPRLLLRPPRRHRAVAGQRLRADPRCDLLRAAEAVRGRAVRGRGRACQFGCRPAVPDHLRRVDHRRAAVRGDGRADRADRHQAARGLPGGDGAGRGDRRSRCAGCRPHRAARPTGRARPAAGCSASARWRSRCWTGPGRGGRSAAWSARPWSRCCRPRTGRSRTRTPPVAGGDVDAGSRRSRRSGRRRSRRCRRLAAQVRPWPVRPVLLVPPVHRDRVLGDVEGEPPGLVEHLAVGGQLGVPVEQLDVQADGASRCS